MATKGMNQEAVSKWEPLLFIFSLCPDQFFSVSNIRNVVFFFASLYYVFYPIRTWFPSNANPYFRIRSRGIPFSRSFVS